MRKWLSEIFRKTPREATPSNSIIIADRAPDENDIHPIGAIWLNGTDKYIVKNGKVQWEKL